MKKKLYLIKFSLIALVFSIVAIVMHLLPSTDLLFIKESGESVAVGPNVRNSDLTQSNND